MQCVSAGIVVQPYRSVRCTAHEGVCVMHRQEHTHSCDRFTLCIVAIVCALVRVLVSE